jgi:alkylation response protein AidB-like acyl-CoA dehydrogenase
VGLILSLIYSNEQLMLKDSAQKFFKEKSPISQIRYLRDSNDSKGFAASVWNDLTEMGFASVLVPEHFGGMGMGYVEAGIISEQIGHQLTAVPFLSTSIAAISAICHSGTDFQKTKWLPKLISAKAIATLAVDEQPKHKPEFISLSWK